MHTITHGFLPLEDPITKLPTEFEAWENAAAQLPKLLLENNFRHHLDTLPGFHTELLTNQQQLERAMLILSYLGHAYVWCDADKPATTLSASIAIPWSEVADNLQRPPVLSYFSYALYNWRRIDQKQPIALGNIVLLQNFLGGIDEEWFILVHIDIEAKAVPALQSILPTFAAANEGDHQAILKNLQRIASSIEDMCDSLDRMTEHCDPYIYYNRVRPYIHGWKDSPSLPDGLIYEGVPAYNNQPQQFKGETGAQSSIIPSLDALLGITHEDSPLKAHLIEMLEYMPLAHREFVVHLQEQNSPLRHYVLSNYKKYPDLRDAYNACVHLLTRFRSTHLAYAAHYIQKQVQTSTANPIDIGTGGTPFMAYLKEHKNETDRFLI